MLNVTRLTMALLAAGPFVNESFEGPNLLDSQVPPGNWSSLNAASNRTLIRSSMAAKVGGLGIRVSDNNASMNAGSSISLSTSTLSTSSASLSMRHWIRLNSTSADGSMVVSQVLSSMNDQASVCDLRVAFPNAQLVVSGVSLTDVFDEQPTTSTLVVGQWHLIECWVRGIGTASATRTAYFDGQLVATKTGLNFSGVTLNEAQVGQPYVYDGRFTGTYDIDEFWTASAPKASKFALEAIGASNTPQRCQTVAYKLIDSEGKLGVSGAAFNASVTTSGAALFSDANCQTPLSSLPFVDGVNAASFYVRVPPGTTTLTIAYPDFFSASLTLSSDDQEDSGVPGTDAGGSDAGVTDAGVPDSVAVADASQPSPPDADTPPDTDAGPTATNGDAGSPNGPASNPTTLDPLNLRVGCSCESASLSVCLIAVLWSVTVRRRHQTTPIARK
jgi:hypothetical protein